MWTLQASCRQPCKSNLTLCSLPHSKTRHQENLQSSKVASWTLEARFILCYHKHVVTPVPLQTVSPVAGNLLCVAIGETMSYAAICMGIYTIYTAPGRWHPRRQKSFQVAVVSLVLRCFLSFRMCFVIRKELEEFSYIFWYLYLSLWRLDCHFLLFQMKIFQCC